MLRAVLVDDEEAARQELAQLLEHYCSAMVELAAAAASASEARMLIPQVRPDLVFLDVEMPGENGFALLRSLPRESYGEVVFVTAYDRYAVQALRVSAADYLLKPVQPEELLAAVERVYERRRQRIRSPSVETLLDNLSGAAPRRIVVPSGSGYHVLLSSEIVYVESERNYARFATVHREKFLSVRPLGHWEEVLAPMGFFRVHRSYLVNFEHVREIRRQPDGDFVIVSTQERLPVAQRRVEAFIRRLQSG
jgi:two-component system LytT family response regulator